MTLQKTQKQIIEKRKTVNANARKTAKTKKTKTHSKKARYLAVTKQTPFATPLHGQVDKARQARKHNLD